MRCDGGWCVNGLHGWLAVSGLLLSILRTAHDETRAHKCINCVCTHHHTQTPSSSFPRHGIIIPWISSLSPTHLHHAHISTSTSCLPCTPNWGLLICAHSLGIYAHRLGICAHRLGICAHRLVIHAHGLVLNAQGLRARTFKHFYPVKIRTISKLEIPPKCTDYIIVEVYAFRSNSARREIWLARIFHYIQPSKWTTSKCSMYAVHCMFLTHQYRSWWYCARFLPYAAQAGS